MIDVGDLVARVLDLARQHPSWIAAIVFATAFLEALAVVGLFIPGTPILLAAGALAVVGGATLWPIILAGAVGAVLGDELSYAAGRHGRDRIVALWPLSRHPEWLERGEAYFARHGAMSVAVGRFLPVVRPMVPLAAGTMGMAPWRFHVVNVASALVWSPAYVLGGALLGVSAATVGAVSGRLLTGAAVLLVLVLATATLFRFLLARLVPRLAACRDGAVAWAQGRDGWGAKLTRAALDPARGDLRLLALSSVVLLGLLGLIALLIETVAGGGSAAIDSAVSNFVQGLRVPGMDQLMRTATLFGEWPVVTGVTVLVCAWLVFRRAHHLALGVAGTMAVSAVLVPALKSLLHVARPSAIYTGVDAFSFPSGHATSAATLYALLAWLVGRSLPPRHRIYPALLAGLIVALVSLSRVYLRAHWPSDVIGGVLFGFAMTAALAIAYRRAGRERTRPAPTAAATILALAACVMVFGPAAFRKGVDLYKLAPAPRIVSETDWRLGRIQLPSRRVDLQGEPEERFTLAITERPDAFAARAQRLGWRRAPALNPASAAAFLDPSAPLDALPALPVLHDGQAPVLTLIRAVSADRRLVLRLWPARLQVGERAPAPVLVGSVVPETARRFAGLLTTTEAHDQLGVVVPELSRSPDDVARTDDS